MMKEIILFPDEKMIILKSTLTGLMSNNLKLNIVINVICFDYRISKAPFFFKKQIKEGAYEIRLDCCIVYVRTLVDLGTIIGLCMKSDWFTLHCSILKVIIT